MRVPNYTHKEIENPREMDVRDENVLLIQLIHGFSAVGPLAA